jgi:hypothetical protein
MSSTSIRTWSIAGLLLAASCSDPHLPPADAGCDGAECDAGDACADGRCDASVDPCDSIVCPAGQVCIDGRCMLPDLCAGVDCSNPGDACDPRDGSCHAGGADDDADGHTIAAGDCDDGAATVYPGAPEACDGVDQDCDLAVDDGFADADGDGFDTCGFGNPAQADCDDGQASRHPGADEACDGVDNDCNGDVDEGVGPRPCATACGTGEERCDGGGWVCSAPEVCECTPAGRVETEGCGYCGTRSRTCGGDLRWTNWSTCGGSGECEAGTTDDASCGNCNLGSWRRTCDPTCHWGSFGACVGGGECAAGTEATEPCGSCDDGLRTHTCTAGCFWGTWGGCVGAGCTPDATESQACGNCEAGTQSRSCTGTCAWGDWGPCSVGGSTEACLDCEVDLGVAGDDPYVSPGFYWRESTARTFRWTNGYAVLWLGVAPSATTLSITWAGRYWTEADCSIQEGSVHAGVVLIDGVEAGRMDLPHGVYLTSTYPIPAAAAADGWIEIVLDSAECFRPSTCSGSADTRCLALQVDFVTAC